LFLKGGDALAKINRGKQFEFDEIQKCLKAFCNLPNGQAKLEELKEKCSCWRDVSEKQAYPYWSLVWIYEIGPNGKNISYGEIAKHFNTTTNQVHRWKWVGLRLFIDYEPNNSGGHHHSDRGLVSRMATEIENAWKRKHKENIMDEQEVVEVHPNEQIVGEREVEHPIIMTEEKKTVPLSLFYAGLFEFVFNNAMAVQGVVEVDGVIFWSGSVTMVVRGYIEENYPRAELPEPVYEWCSSRWRVLSDNGLVRLAEGSHGGEYYIANPKGFSIEFREKEKPHIQKVIEPPERKTLEVSEFGSGLFSFLWSQADEYENAELDSDKRSVFHGRPIDLIKRYVEELYPNATLPEKEDIWLGERWTELLNTPLLSSIKGRGANTVYVFMRPDEVKINTVENHTITQRRLEGSVKNKSAKNTNVSVEEQIALQSKKMIQMLQEEMNELDVSYHEYKEKISILSDEVASFEEKLLENRARFNRTTQQQDILNTL